MTHVAGIDTSSAWLDSCDGSSAPSLADFLDGTFAGSSNANTPRVAMVLTFTEPALASGVALATKVDTLCNRINETSPRSLLQLLIGLEDAPSPMGMSSTFVLRGGSGAGRSLRALAGLAMAAALPEAVLADVGGLGCAPTPRLVSLASLLRGPELPPALNTERFFRGSWPRDVAVAAPTALALGRTRAGLNAPLPFFAARLPPSSLLAAGLLPGDSALIRRVGAATLADRRPPSLLSAVVYVNAPPEDDSDDDDADDARHELADLAAGDGAAPALALPATLCSDLGLEPGDAVSLTPYDEPPMAESVTLTTVLVSAADGGSGSASASHDAAALLASARAALGLVAAAPASNAVAAALAAAARDEDGAPALDTSQAQHAALVNMLRAGACRHAPLVAGQTLPVVLGGAVGDPPILLRVAATRPRHSAVIVGPNTEVTLAAA